jgi:hypothetical protein
MSIIPMCRADAAPIREARSKRDFATQPGPHTQWCCAPSRALAEAHMRRARVEAERLRRLGSAPRHLEPRQPAVIIKDRV